MKKTILLFVGIALLHFHAYSQDYYDELTQAVSNFEEAKSTSQYMYLADYFSNLANTQKTDWKSYYYAALCNAKIAWQYESMPYRIRPFTNLAEEQLSKAELLLDKAKQEKELSEVYVVKSMILRAKDFMNPDENSKNYNSKVQKYLDVAETLNSENPRVTYLRAWETYNVPKMWNNNKAYAIELAENALEKFDEESESRTYPDWGKEECEQLLETL